MRRLLDITGGLLLGGGIGAVVTTYLLENKMQKQYIEQVGSIRRALEAARIDAMTPVATEEELAEDIELPFEMNDDAGMALTADGVVLTPKFVSVPDVPVAPNEDLLKEEGEKPNPYWTAVNSDGPSFTVLEEEDFYDEDGREKEQLTFVFSEGQPHFYQSGQQIDDWKDKVGTSIIDDMRKAASETGSPVLFIRNNTTDVDYEVIFEQP